MKIPKINIFLIIISFIIISFIIGFIIGRQTKVCKKLESLKKDTIYVDRDITGGIGSPIIINDTINKTDTFIKSIPKVKIIKNIDTFIQKINDTIFKVIDNQTSYYQTDSINYISPYGDKLGVYIIDTGNCHGVFDRQTK